MCIMLKKSVITDWWVARSNSKMTFINILSFKTIDLNDKLLIVGYLDKDQQELGTSTNYVVQVTEEGVLTAKGTFYPFEEAHELYLRFLIEANKKNTIIAFNWDYAKNKINWINSKVEIKRTILIADIIKNGKVSEGEIFDFIPKKMISIMFTGYSNKLSANIVLSTFSRRNICISLSIPEFIKKDIYISNSIYRKEHVSKVQNIFKCKCLH